MSNHHKQNYPPSRVQPGKLYTTSPGFWLDVGENNSTFVVDGTDVVCVLGVRQSTKDNVELTILTAHEGRVGKAWFFAEGSYHRFTEVSG